MSTQHERIKQLMADGYWRTLNDIARLTLYPTPSISAHLRHLRKPEYGGFTVFRRHIGNGLYAYRVKQSEAACTPTSK